MASVSTPSQGSRGPMVTRRIGAAAAHAASSLAASFRNSQTKSKPSIRKTIESLTSTGSQAEYFQPEQTIILFDWDDTLCPSTWIRENRPALSFFKMCPLDEKYQRPLQELQQHVEATLQLAMKVGKLVIVTNAMEPWVETSCRNFMPAILPLVEQIPVIYARSVFDLLGCERPRSRGAALPGLYTSSGQNRLKPVAKENGMAPQKWKELAFEQEISVFYSRYEDQSWKNVISIGDSIFERDAVKRVVVNRPSLEKKCRTKITKLLNEPAIDELIEEVRVVHDVLGLMVQYDGNLEIEIDEEDLKLNNLSLAEKLMDR